VCVALGVVIFVLAFLSTSQRAARSAHRVAPLIAGTPVLAEGEARVG
jgi:hypothetical protein